jgi:hypothetical protein
VPAPFDYVMCIDDKVFVYDSDTHIDTACHLLINFVLNNLH